MSAGQMGCQIRIGGTVVWSNRSTQGAAFSRSDSAAYRKVTLTSDDQVLPVDVIDIQTGTHTVRLNDIVVSRIA